MFIVLYWLIWASGCADLLSFVLYIEPQHKQRVKLTEPFQIVFKRRFEKLLYQYSFCYLLFCSFFYCLL